MKRNLNFNEWMHKLKKLKTKSCVRLMHSLLFIFSLMIDSLIKQQTAWSQCSSKYQIQKKCTRSEISINLSFYVYIIPKRNNYSSNSNRKKGKWQQSWNWSLKIYIRIISIIPISIQVLIPELIFPVYKIDQHVEIMFLRNIRRYQRGIQKP